MQSALLQENVLKMEPGVVKILFAKVKIFKTRLSVHYSFTTSLQVKTISSFFSIKRSKAFPLHDCHLYHNFIILSLSLVLLKLILYVVITAVTCAPLSIPAKAILLTVSCGNTYGSNCAFGCQNGYGSPSGNVTRTCLQSGQWSVNEINCTGTSICSNTPHTIC